MDLAWTSHPARRRPQDLALMVGVILIAAWAVAESLGSAYLAVLAALLLLVSVAPFWLPTRYRLTDDGVEERRLGRQRFRRWNELRRAEIGESGALLSPFAKRSWLDRHRGILVSFDGADREQVVAALRQQIPRPAA